MAIVINGSGTVTGISVGGLPDGIVDAGTLATNSVDSAELIDGAVDDSHMAAMAASKLTGALPAISGASLTGITTGKVLQVKWHQNATQDNTSSTSWVDTNTIAITPASGSTLLFIHTLNVALARESGVALRIFRDGTTDIGSQPSGADADSASHFARTGGPTGTQIHTSHAATWFYVHGGNGSTSMSFKTQRRMTASSNTSYFQYYNSPSSLTIIEIGA